MSRDPLVGVASGAFGDSSHLAWFKSFLLLELCGLFSIFKTQLNPKHSRVFQLPVFFLGLRGLYKGTILRLKDYSYFHTHKPIQVHAQYIPSSPSTPPQLLPPLSHVYFRSSKLPKQLPKPSHRTCQASPLLSAYCYCPVMYLFS